ncbi:MAG: pseudouridine synthase [Lachnospiraceae bacterium]|nr:pseudouridine synthase [Lachnospiraceae bacterium]
MEENKIRINKYIAEAGICSRREADKLIAKGLVTINGKTASMGDRAGSKDKVTVSGKPIGNKNEKVVLAFYKPVGITCTEKDKFADKTILEYVKYPIRITYAGRLDKDSEGLILLTNDGELIQKLMKGSAGHEKEYVVKVKKELTDRFLEEMEKGVYLKELEQTTRSCKMEKTGKYTFRIILTQGLNRQIRRMCRELGNEAVSIKRVRIMNVQLGKLPYGKWRLVCGSELEKLYEGVGLQPAGSNDD